VSQSQHQFIINLGAASSELSQKIFKDLQEQLVERWPFLVRIDSVIPLPGPDNIHSMEITKKFVGITLQALYSEHMLSSPGIHIEVLIFKCRSHFSFPLCFSFDSFQQNLRMIFIQLLFGVLVLKVRNLPHEASSMSGILCDENFNIRIGL
jgi:hypothetical protein